MKTPFGTDLQPQRERTLRRRWPLFAAVGVALSLLVGASFAASITVNGDEAIEFGQGNVAVVSCTAATDLTPSLESGYEYDSDTQISSFVLTRVVLTGVPHSCKNTWILITLLGPGGDPLDEILFKPTSADSHTGGYALDTVTGSPCTGSTGVGLGTGVLYCGPETGGTDSIASTTNPQDIEDMTVETFDSAPTTTL